jgi:hypothetical protein
MGRLPVKFRKVTGKSPTDAVKKVVDWFKKNKRDFEGLVKEEVELGEGPMDGFLRLTFKSPADVKKAMKVSDTEFGYRHFSMDKARTRPELDIEGDRDDLQRLKGALKSAGIKFKIDLEEEVELDEALKKGAKVEVPHKGKRTQGTVVRYVPQRGAASPYYVVYVGEYGSIEVPAHKIKEEVELDEGKYAVTFQKGTGVGARSFHTVYVQAKDDGEAIKKAQKDKGLEKGFEYSSVRKEEVELDEANYEIKNGKVHISKKEFAKVSKDYKGKNTMTVLDPKTGATVNMPVVFEEVELDEAFPANPAQKAWAGAYKRGAPKGKFQVKTASSKKGKITVTDFDSLDAAKKHLAAMEKKGQRGIISQDGKLVKEEVVKEGTWHVAKSSKELAGLKKLMKKPIKFGKDGNDAVDAIAPFIGDDQLYDDLYDEGKRNPKDDARPLIKAAMKRLSIKEEVELNEANFNIKNDVVYITKNEYISLPNEGKGKDEEGNPTLSIFMSGEEKDPVPLPVQFIETEAVDPADIDIDATDVDVKAAEKNIIMQMRKVQSLRGNFPVEFLDGKKFKVDSKIAMAVQAKYNKIKKPADKEKFQTKVAKSYKDMLAALKEDKLITQEPILDRISRKIQERKNG